MELMIIKYTKAAAKKLYDRDISVRFEFLDSCGLCLYVVDEILFNKRLLTGLKNKDECEYWWKLMIHEITHFEVHNGDTKTHKPKFYTTQKKNIKLTSDLKQQFIEEVTA